MSSKKVQDIGFVVGLLAGLAGIVLVLWVVMTIISGYMEDAERCRLAGGVYQTVRCVDVIENY